MATKYQNVIVIDDDSDDQEIFLDAIKDVSSLIQCTAFNDAEVAYNKLADKTIAPDAIFLDLNMPKMNGIEFLKAIKQTDVINNIPVIIYSTSAFIQASSTQLADAASYIEKPCNYLDLVQSLKGVIDDF